MNPPLMTYQQVAEYFGITVRAVRRLVARKELAVVRMGHRTVRIRPSDAEKALGRMTEAAA